MTKLNLFLAIFFLTSCSTAPVPHTEATITPSNRLIAFQIPEDAQLTIIRDKGIAHSGCYWGIFVDDILAARIDSGEKATFLVKPASHKVKITRDPQGKGVCHIGGEHTELEVELKKNDVQRYRLSHDLKGNPILTSYEEDAPPSKDD